MKLKQFLKYYTLKFLFVVSFTENVAKTTTLTELMGINTAAINGDIFPLTAKDNPTTLYIKEMTKLMTTIFKAMWVYLINLSRAKNFFDSIIPSQAGEKL